MNVTNNTFKAEVLEATVPVLVDFYTDWCPYCVGLDHVLKAVANEANGRYKVVKVNAAEDRDLAAAHEVTHVPTILVFKNGVVTYRRVGSQIKADLVKAVEADIPANGGGIS